jgi:hypothetical protein
VAKESHVDVIWEEVKAGTRKVTARERRRCLVYVDELGEIHSNVELSKMFGVSESVIRDDKKRLLREFGATLTPEAQIELLARHLRSIDTLIGNAEAGRKACNAAGAGSINERFYIETLLKLQQERRTTLENTGILRKELGTLNVQEEHWVATTDEAGIQNVHEATPAERQGQIH